MHKKGNIIFIVLLGFCLFVYFFRILGANNIKYFSLIDDGQTIDNANNLINCVKNTDCTKVKGTLIEKDFGRFRPFYWIFQTIWVVSFGYNPLLQHTARFILIGGLIIYLWLRIAGILNVNKLASFIGVIIFVTSYSFAENIVRLGPIEPFQLILLSCLIISILEFKSPVNFGLCWLIFLFTKETSIIFLPIIILYFIFNRNNFGKKYRQYFLFTVIPVVLFLIGQRLSASGANIYANNFEITLSSILKNLAGYITILKINYGILTIVLLFSYVYLALKSVIAFLETKNISREGLLILFAIASFVILLPWQYVMERYILLFWFMSTIIFSVFISELRFTISLFLNRYVIILMSILFLNILVPKIALSIIKSVNYSSWYSEFVLIDKAHTDLLYKYKDRKICYNMKDNLNNWEILFETPIHMKYFYNTNLNAKIWDGSESDCLIFTRIPGDNIKSIDDGQARKIISIQKFTVRQIEENSFYQNFIRNPLSLDVLVYKKPFEYQLTMQE